MPTVVRFSAGKSLKGKLIQNWTGGWPTHVEFLLDDILLGSEPGKGVIYSKEPGKRQLLDLVLPVELGYTYAISQLGKKYDWLGLFGCGFNIPWLHTEDAWFCTELVVTSLEMAGLPVLDEWDFSHPQIISPWELLLKLRPIALEQIEAES